MINDINKDIVVFNSLKNSESTFGGDISVADKYPKAMIFAGYSDLDDGSIVVGTTFQEIIDQGTNETFQIEEFPYSIISNLNANPIRWGYFVNESFKRIYMCMQSVNNYIDNAKSITDTNNTAINTKFNAVSESMDLVKYTYLESNKPEIIRCIPHKINKICVQRFFPFMNEDVSDENQKMLFTIMDYIPNEESEYKLKTDIVTTVNIKNSSITPEKIGYAISREENQDAAIKYTKSLTVSGDEVQTWVQEYQKNTTASMHAVSHKFLENRLNIYKKRLTSNFTAVEDSNAQDGTTNIPYNSVYLVSDEDSITELQNIINDANENIKIEVSNSEDSDVNLSLRSSVQRELINLNGNELNIESESNVCVVLIDCRFKTLNIKSPVMITVNNTCEIENINILIDGVSLSCESKTSINIDIPKIEGYLNNLSINSKMATISLVEKTGNVDELDLIYANKILINN